MRETKRLSIVIPVYNAEKYIEASIQSLFEQSYLDLELIAVNDGSNDGSAEILQRMARKDSRLRVVSQPNQGVSAARNRGVSEATGEYLAFVDADDTAEPDLYEKLIARLESGQAQLAYCYLNTVIEAGAALSVGIVQNKVIEGSGEQVLRAHLREEILVGIYSFVIEASLMGNKGITFSSQYCYGEDQEFVMRCLEVCQRVVCVPEKLYNYRLNPDGAMQQVTLRRFDWLRICLDFERRCVGNLNIDPVLLRELRVRKIPKIFFETVSFLYRNGKSEDELTGYILREKLDRALDWIGFSDLFHSHFCNLWKISPRLFFAAIKLIGTVSGKPLKEVNDL